MCGMDLLAPGRTLPQEVSMVATESTTQTSLEGGPVGPPLLITAPSRPAAGFPPGFLSQAALGQWPSTLRALDQTSFAQHRSPPLGSLCLGPPSS